MILFRQYLRAQRTAFIIWLGAMVLLAIGLASSAGAFDQSDLMTGLMAAMPPAIRALVGLIPGLGPVDTFIAAKLGVWLGMVLPVYASILAVGAVTREVDRGSIDFLLALPVERGRLLLARWAGMVFNVTALALGTWVALVIGMKAAHISGSYLGYLWMTLQAWFLGLAFGSLAMLASIWIDDYGTAVKYTLGGIAVLFAADVAMKVANVPKLGRAFDPYAFFDAAQPILKNHILWGDAAVLLVLTAVATWLAVRAFARKEIQA